MIQIISIGERGLAITFDKWDLIELKNGKTMHGELVGPNGKTKIMFMRDQTFLELQKKFDKKVAQVKAVADSQATVAKLGEELGGV